MNASVILAHPYCGSFNHALFCEITDVLEKNSVNVFAHDLYADNFNPLVTVEELGKIKTRDSLVLRYSGEMMESDLLIFIHPNWWGQPPAILTGYIDRVIRPPYAYDFSSGDSGGGLPLGKLKGKYGLVFNTSNTAAARENLYFGDPLEKIWGRCIFGFCGIEKYERKIFRIISDSSLEEREKWLAEAKQTVLRVLKMLKA